MNQPLIVLGDKTSHGGTVISCAPTTGTLGKGWARVGDMVACPRCKGVFPIIQGNASLIESGRAVTYHGCKVACGALLIASQMHTTAEPSSGVAPDAASSASDNGLTKGFGAIGSGLIAGYQDEPLNDTGQRFRGRFQVLDRTSGEPVTGQSVRVRSSDGQSLTCSTDAEGYTQWVERDTSETLAFDLAEPGQT
ncbi:PAAR domain-containing protein [Achromobacter aloeverae]